MSELECSKPTQALLALAFDIGEKRIGSAIGNGASRTAHALNTLSYHGREFPWGQIEHMLQSWQPSVIVVGLPEERTCVDSARRAKMFARQIRERYGKPVYLIDESYTSVNARQLFSVQRGMGRRHAGQRKGHLDGLAAKLIAEDFFAWYDIVEPFTD